LGDHSPQCDTSTKVEDIPMPDCHDAFQDLPHSLGNLPVQPSWCSNHPFASRSPSTPTSTGRSHRCRCNQRGHRLRDLEHPCAVAMIRPVRTQGWGRSPPPPPAEKSVVVSGPVYQKAAKYEQSSKASRAEPTPVVSRLRFGYGGQRGIKSLRAVQCVIPALIPKTSRARAVLTCGALS